MSSRASIIVVILYVCVFHINAAEDYPVPRRSRQQSDLQTRGVWPPNEKPTYSTEPTRRNVYNIPRLQPTTNSYPRGSTRRSDIYNIHRASGRGSERVDHFGDTEYDYTPRPPRRTTTTTTTTTTPRPCASEATANHGYVESPNYPDTYPPDSDCYTLIRAKAGEVIVLQFETIFMERHPTCGADYVEIYDSPSIEGPSLGRFCRESEKTASEIRSTSNAILLHFHSDDIVNLQGYSARYWVQPITRSAHAQPSSCSVWSDETRGVITSPGYPDNYPPNSSCRVPLDAGPGNLITLYIIDIQLDPYKDCPYDKIEVRDGLTEDAYLLGRFCGASGEPERVTSSGSALFVSFASDSYLNGRGFKVEFLIHKKPDAPTRQTGKSGEPDLKPRDPLALLDQPSDVSLRYRESHIFRCVPQNRNAQTLWYKDDKELHILNNDPNLKGLLLVGNHTVWVKEMDVSLRGNYTCRVIADQSSRDVSFKIAYGGPAIVTPTCEIVMRKIPQDLTFTGGETVIIPCEGAGHQISTRWARNGHPLSSADGRLTVLPIGFLTINDSRPEDSGVYSCITTDESKNCSRTISAAIVVLPRAKLEEVCGRVMINPSHPVERIAGGQDARRGAHPWQALLRYRSGDAFCSGSLVSERYVVTAAHCVENLRTRTAGIEVALGKLFIDRDETDEVVTHVRDIRIHPNYRLVTVDSDIALVELADHIVFTKFVMPVCLGNAQHMEKVFFKRPKQRVLVTGWGRTAESVKASSRLQEVEVPIHSLETCRRSTNFTVTENMFCAGTTTGGVTKDACDGDSGGPLVGEYEGRWYLLGIVSWGESALCGAKGSYGFYTKINVFHSWIKNVIN